MGRRTAGAIVIVASLMTLACGSDAPAPSANTGPTSGATAEIDPPATDASVSTSPVTAAPTTAAPTIPATELTTSPPSSDLPPPSSSSPGDDSTPADESGPDDDSVPVNVYWAWEVIDPLVCCPEKIAAGGRQVEAPSVARGALEALLSGPDAVESEIGMLSTIPAETRLLDLAVADGVATVDLSGEFEEPSGSLVERFRVAQVVFTLTQFDNIDRVRFRVDGVDRDELMSHGIPVGEGVTRDSDADLRPAILIEHPHPGAEVTDPFTIRGESNTFEGTVEYVVTAAGGDGLVVAEGFTTATAGSGTWGTFETSVGLDDSPTLEQESSGSVIVFETSARDGSQINVVEYPITLLADGGE